VTCTSWLLDPVLADYLPEDSNVVRFQRRFELMPRVEDDSEDGGEEAREDLLRFVFGTLTTPLDELPTRTVPQRAVVAHLKAGGRWHNRTGRVALRP
jgi:hypothetical protein